MMETKLTSFDDINMIKSLQEGEVVAFPSETVYGLGCVYDNLEAFNKLVQVKKRPPDKPFTLMLGKDYDFSKYAYVDDNIQRVIDKFVPGAITLLLKPRDNLPYQVTLKSPSIGIRVSSNTKLQELIYKVGKPLLVPSANLSGQPPLVTAKDVFNQFKDQISYIVDDICLNSKPSTIVNLSIKDEISLIRQGDISFEDIKKVFKGE